MMELLGFQNHGYANFFLHKLPRAWYSSRATEKKKRPRQWFCEVLDTKELSTGEYPTIRFKDFVSLICVDAVLTTELISMCEHCEVMRREREKICFFHNLSSLCLWTNLLPSLGLCILSLENKRKFCQCHWITFRINANKM